MAEEIKVLMTERPDAPASNSTLTTPVGSADLQVITVTWYSQVGIRVLRTYLQSLLGFILAVGTGAAGAVGISLPMGNFTELFISSASLAVAPAAIALLQNAVELLAKLDTSAPQMRL